MDIKSKSQDQLSVNDSVNSLSAIEHWAQDDFNRSRLKISFFQKSVDNVIVFFPVVKNVFAENAISAQSW
jgi:hypothetical protein